MLVLLKFIYTKLSNEIYLSFSHAVIQISKTPLIVLAGEREGGGLIIFHIIDQVGN